MRVGVQRRPVTTAYAFFAAMALSLAATNTASAQQATGDSAVFNPVTVFTKDVSRGPSADLRNQLLVHARQQGRIRVIAGLRMAMESENGLTALAAERQAAALQAMQGGVARRVLGAEAANAEPFTLIPYTSMFVTADQASALLDDPDVVSVQEDLPQPPLDAESIPLIHADALWAKADDGTGFTVAILDTGVAKTHPILSGKIKSEACYSTKSGAHIKSTCPGGVTSSTAPGSGVNCNLATPGCDHGTHVASIAAAKPSTDNIAVARGASIISINVFTRVELAKLCNNAAPCLLSYTTDQIKALERVYALRSIFKISSINMSFGSGKYAAVCDKVSPALTTAIKNLRTAGIATVIASGNNGYSGFISFPACISAAIPVGNSTKADILASSSNHSSLVHLLGPGTGVKGAVPGAAYAVKSGTSMASAHVAGGFALLKQAKPTASVNDIFAALSCSGKMIDLRTSGSTSVPLSPARPRIDLIGAYNYLLKPRHVVRNWDFSSKSEAHDWSPFRGTWAILGTRNTQTPIMAGWVGTSVENCNHSLEVSAKMKRVDPGSTFFSNSGILFKSQLDYAAHKVSGYWAAYNNCPTDTSGHCSGSASDPPGQALFWRLDNYDFENNSGTATLLCAKRAPVVVGQLNTVDIVSLGSSHTYSLNGKAICAVNDATYTAGAIMTAAFIASAGGQAYAVDYVHTVSRDSAKAAAAAALVMNPAEFIPKATPAGMAPFGSAPVPQM